MNNIPNKFFIHRAWALIKPYWCSDERWIALSLLLINILISILSVIVSIWLNSWNNDFYHALQKFEKKEFWHLNMQFCFIAAFMLLLSIYRYYFTNLLTIRWRRWLTKLYFNLWLSSKKNYKLETISNDNRDKRIAEDIDRLTSATLKFSISLLTSGITLLSVISIFCNVSGIIKILINIQGYMVWFAILFSVISQFITQLIGQKIRKLNFIQHLLEANMRYEMTIIRDNSKSIYLLKKNNKAINKTTIKNILSLVFNNCFKLIRTQKHLIVFNSGFNQLAIIFPMLTLTASQSYLNYSINIGTFIQISNAFSQVQGALSWFTNSYCELSKWKNVIDRLTGFIIAINKITTTSTIKRKLIFSENTDVYINTAKISLPKGTKILYISNFIIRKGEHTLITAPLGVGISIFFHTLSGVWSWWQGKINMPTSTLFLIEKPYLPIDSLRQVIAYPNKVKYYSQKNMELILKLCKMDTLINELDCVCNWAQRFSVREQQLISFARALISKPKWIFLDEASSFLDLESEQYLYNVLIKYLPTTTLVSFSHKSSVYKFHVRIVDLRTLNKYAC